MLSIKLLVVSLGENLLGLSLIESSELDWKLVFYIFQILVAVAMGQLTIIIITVRKTLIKHIA